MKMVSSVLAFTVGIAAGVGAYKGIEAMNTNKYKVKRKINDAIDTVTSVMN